MSTCGLCGTRLTPGLGHACSTVGSRGAPPPPPPSRTPTPKTWRELERAAAENGLDVFRTEGAVSLIHIGSNRPVISITSEELSVEDADRVVRAALGAALDAIRSIR